MSYKLSVEGSELVIRIALNDAKPVLSKSGKSQVIASTEGFTNISTPFGTVKIGMNVITTDNDWTGGARSGPLPEQPKPALVKNGGAAAH